MKPAILKPGAATLAELEDIYRMGRPVKLAPGARKGI